MNLHCFNAVTMTIFFQQHHMVFFFSATIKVGGRKSFLASLRYLLRVALGKTLTEKAYNLSKSIQLNEIHPINPNVDDAIYTGQNGLCHGRARA